MSGMDTRRSGPLQVEDLVVDGGHRRGGRHRHAGHLAGRPRGGGQAFVGGFHEALPHRGGHGAAEPADSSQAARDGQTLAAGFSQLFIGEGLGVARPHPGGQVRGDTEEGGVGGVLGGAGLAAGGSVDATPLGRAAGDDLFERSHHVVGLVGFDDLVLGVSVLEEHGAVVADDLGDHGGRDEHAPVAERFRRRR